MPSEFAISLIYAFLKPGMYFLQNTNILYIFFRPSINARLLFLIDLLSVNIRGQLKAIAFFLFATVKI